MFSFDFDTREGDFQAEIDATTRQTANGSTHQQGEASSRGNTSQKHGIPPPGRNPIGSIRLQPIENRRNTRPLPGRMRKPLAGAPIRGKKWKLVHFRADAPSSGPNFHPRRNPTQSLSPRSKAATLLPLQRRFGKKRASGRGPISYL